MVAVKKEACVGLEKREAAKKEKPKHPIRKARSDGACFCRHGAFIFPFTTLSTHYMGRRFLYSDLTSLHTWALSNVSKTMYKIK